MHTNNSNNETTTISETGTDNESSNNKWERSGSAVTGHINRIVFKETFCWRMS
jgi:hypothetical protein